jgi:hypothetical protein
MAAPVCEASKICSCEGSRVREELGKLIVFSYKDMHLRVSTSPSFGFGGQVWVRWMKVVPHCALIVARAQEGSYALLAALDRLDMLSDSSLSGKRYCMVYACAQHVLTMSL